MSAIRAPLSSFDMIFHFSACAGFWHSDDTLLCKAWMWHMKCLSFHSSLSLSPQVSYIPSSNSFVYQGFVRGKSFGQFGLQRLGEWTLHFNSTSTWKETLNPSVNSEPCLGFTVHELHNTHSCTSGGQYIYLNTVFILIIIHLSTSTTLHLRGKYCAFHDICRTTSDTFQMTV